MQFAISISWRLAIGHLGGIDPYAVKASKIISSLLDVDAEIKDVNFERPTYNKSSNVVNSKHDRSLQFGIHVNDWQDSQNCNIEQRMILVVIRSEGTILVDLPVLGGLARFAAVHRQRTILVVVRSEGTILAVCLYSEDSQGSQHAQAANDPCCCSLRRHDPCYSEDSQGM